MMARQIATDIVRKIVKEGYKAYFAGGWVRDYLMGHPSDDIDIATDAPPEVILNLFPRTLLVGLSFGVVVVVLDGHQFEVATFRKDIDYENGRSPKQIELSTAEEDAKRRDFTINGMFYDPLEDVIHDFVQGADDIKHRIIRAIGDPDQRFVEDRLRMVRAVRFAARFDFTIEQNTKDAINASADTLFPAVAMERIYQEIGKMAKYPRTALAFVEMHRLNLLPVIFPTLRGTHLNEIKKRVSSFEDFPENADPILYLLQLFPNCQLEEAQELCLYLKTSNKDVALAELYVALRNAVESERTLGIIDLNAFVGYYAKPEVWKCLAVIAATHPEKERAFLQTHRERAEQQKKHIQRILDRSPLVDAAFLMAQGILPGKLMGSLIKEGERLTVLNNLDSRDAVLALLKSSHLWPKD